MTTTYRIAIIVFDGVEELDTVGPWEVFAAWSDRHPEDGWRVSTYSPDGGDVRCAKGLRLGADGPWSEVDGADIVVVPGGAGTRTLVADPAVAATVSGWARSSEVMASVCTGALVLASAGVLAGRQVATHRVGRALLGEIDPTVDVTDDRVVDDGDVITSAGVSAGIDMALHLVGRLAGESRAAEVADYIEYDHWARVRPTVRRTGR